VTGTIEGGGYQDFMLTGKDFLRRKLLTEERLFHTMAVVVGAVICKMASRGAS
jgi:hypothetical protein